MRTSRGGANCPDGRGRRVMSESNIERDLREARGGAFDEPPISLERLLELQASPHEEVRATAAVLSAQVLARHLLGRLLSCGATATVEMTNQYQCWDLLHVSVPLSGEREWSFTLSDPDFGADDLDSALFDGLVMNRRAPDAPLWSEFQFANPRPDWPDVMSQMDAEGYEAMRETPHRWPNPVNGHDFPLWALADLVDDEVPARMDDVAATAFLRRQAGLPLVGSVKIRLQNEEERPPLAQASSGQLRQVITYLQSPQIAAQTDPFLSNVHTWTREILEPMLAADPATPIEALMLVAEDASCPAMNILRIAPWIPDELRALAALSTPAPLYGDILPISPADHSEQREESSAPPTGMTNVTTAADATSGNSDVPHLVDSVIAVAPDWQARRGYDGEAGFFLYRHRDLLQALFWLQHPGYNAGPIGVPSATLERWSRSLRKLAHALKSDPTDCALLEQLAIDSWLEQA